LNYKRERKVLRSKAKLETRVAESTFIGAFSFGDNDAAAHPQKVRRNTVQIGM